MDTTPRCQMAITHARQSLSRFSHPQMSSVHLILGLFTLQSGIPYNLLRKYGVSIEVLENYLSTRRASAEESTIQDGVPIGKSVVSAFEQAEAEARACHHTYVGTEHLFLGILVEESGEAADLFASVHIDRQNLRQIILEQIRPV